ncbi:MAG TPA: hypothetical protein PKA41_01630 [Verrucomicrobiota bacterium]|nr:hypothetical protein [Verrucomicrobiota bacterium]
MQKITHCANRPRKYVATVDWQQVISLIIVAAAVVALLWGRFRRRKFSFERDTHCGCSAPKSGHAGPSIIFRARKGERPEVRVKMG